MSLKGQQVIYDALESDKKIQDVTFKELAIEYKKRTLTEFEEKDLNSFGLVNEEGHLTIAGSLFADGYQVYQSRVFCTRWNGLDKANGLMDALDDQEFEGNIIYLLKAAMDFVKRNSKKMWKKGPVYRIEYPEYPERAVQEGIVNALIHRDYSVIGSEVHLDIYDDRLEIYSPGGMYDSTFVQNIDPYKVSSSRRNPVLADLFARMDLMERRGSGLRKIIETYKFKENYKEELKPEFRSTESSFFTVLKNLNYSTEKSGDRVAIKSSDKVAIKNKNEQLEAIIKFADLRGEFKTADIEELLSIKSSRARLLISELVKIGKLESIGSNRNRRYHVKE